MGERSAMQRAFGWLRQLTSEKASHGALNIQAAQCAAGTVTVLAIGIEDSDGEHLRRVGDVQGWRQSHASGPEQADVLLKAGSFAVILLDRDACGPVWRQVVERLAYVAPG